MFQQAITIEGDTAKALGALLLVAIGVNGAAVVGQSGLRRKLGELYTAMLGLDGKSGLLRRVESLHDLRGTCQEIEVRVAVIESERIQTGSRLTALERRQSVRRAEDRDE